MNNLNKDVLPEIAQKLNLIDILNFSASSKRLYQKILQNKYLWFNLLKRDFSEEENFDPTPNNCGEESQ